MTEFNITERTEPITLEEVFDFIDDTNISKIDAHELKSRIVDVIQAERNNAIDEFVERLKEKYGCLGYIDEITFEEVDEIAEQMKAGEENEIDR